MKGPWCVRTEIIVRACGDRDPSTTRPSSVHGTAVPRPSEPRSWGGKTIASKNAPSLKQSLTAPRRGTGQRRDAPLVWTRRWRRACRGCEQLRAYMADLSLRFRRRHRRSSGDRRRGDAMRIKAGWWVGLWVALSVSLLLVAGLGYSLFSEGQQAGVPERSAPSGTGVSAEPSAPSLTAAAPSVPQTTPSPAPPALSPAAPSAPTTTTPPSTAGTPAVLPPGPPPAPPTTAPSTPPLSTAETPSAAAPPTTPQNPPTSPGPTAGAPSAAAPTPSTSPAAPAPAATAEAPPAPAPPPMPAEAAMSDANRRQVQETLHRLGYYQDAMGQRRGESSYRRHL
jgi:hypothetical protein